MSTPPQKKKNKQSPKKQMVFLGRGDENGEKVDKSHFKTDKKKLKILPQKLGMYRA